MIVEKLTIKDTFRIWRDKLNSLIDKLATIPATDDNKKYVLNEETIGANKVIIDVPVSITSADSKIAGTLDGNAKTASALEKSVTINGTEFDGSENIKTDFWGLKRNIRISDAEGKYYGNIVTVDGSDDFILTLPPIIKANIDGNLISESVLSKAVSINGVLFDGSSDVINYGVCSTNSDVATKEVILLSPEFTLTQGSCVTVKFLNENTAIETLLLNVNNTGAKPILNKGILIDSTLIENNSVFTFVYDGQAYNIVGGSTSNIVDNDAKVSQTISSTNEEYPLLASPITDHSITSKTEESLFTHSITINPSTGTLTANNITSNGTIEGDSLVSDSITANNITSNNITSNGTIEGDSLVSDSITANNITSNNITSNGNIKGVSLVGDSVTANSITSNGTIEGDSLVSDTITANSITSNGTIEGISLTISDSITANSITSNGNIKGISLVGDSVTANNITSNENIITSKIISLDESILSVESNIYCIGYKIVTESVHSIGSTTYAEFFEKGEETEAGDIIALDSLSTEESYVKATKDSTLIVGVHSDSYGYILGGVEENINGYNPETKFIPVGIKGRVYVNFIGESKLGYPVVPSEIPGVGRLYDYSTNTEESTVEYSQSQIVGYIVEDSSGTEDLRKVKILLR